MSDLYVKVHWPDIQDYMDNSRYKECYNCHSLDEDDSDLIATLMVPEDLYIEVQREKYPKEFIFNGEIYETIWEYINRGDSVLIELQDGELKVVTSATTCKPPLYGPVLFEDNNYVPGITCEIVGVKHKS